MAPKHLISRLSGQLAGGTVIIFIGIVLSRLFGFLYRFVLARYLGPSDYGLFSLGIMTTGILSVFTLVGLHEGTKRFIVFYSEKGRADRLKGTVLIAFMTIVGLSLVICLPVYVLSGQISRIIFSKPELAAILTLFTAAVVFNSLLLLLQEVFVGLERPKLRALTEGFGVRFCPLVCALYVILVEGNIVAIAESYLIGLFLASAAGCLILYKILFYRSEDGVDCRSRELFLYSFPLFFTGIVSLLYNWTDIFLIGVYLPAASVGIYSAVFTITDSMPSIEIAVSALFLTRAVRCFVNRDIDGLERDFRSTRKKIVVLTLPVAVIFVLFPKVLIGLAFGDAFTGGAWAMIILSAGIFAGISFGPCQAVLMAAGQTKPLLSIHAGTSVLNIILNAMLIQIYGIEGAAMATSVCLFLKHAGVYWMARRFFRESRMARV